MSRLRLRPFPRALHPSGPGRSSAAPTAMPPMRAARDDLRAVSGEATPRTVTLPADADRPISDFPSRFNAMRGNGLWQIHIVFPVDCVWPLCTAGAGNCVMKTARIILEQRFYVNKNRLAVMYRLAVHTVKNRKLRHSVAPRRSSGFYVRRILICKANKKRAWGLTSFRRPATFVSIWAVCAI